MTGLNRLALSVMLIIVGVFLVTIALLWSNAIKQEDCNVAGGVVVSGRCVDGDVYRELLRRHQ